MCNTPTMLLVVVLGCFAGASPSRAEDGKAPRGPKKAAQTSEASVQFFSTGPQLPGVSYKMKITIEVEDSITKIEIPIHFSSGASAGLLAHQYKEELKDEPGWKYEVKDDKLVIEGWRDPKTGRVHRVKKIEVETDLPKEYKPKVQLPKKA